MSCDLIQLATSGVARLQPYHPGKPIEELERELGISNIVKLASNENPLGCSPKVKEAVRKFNDYSRYPDGNAFALKNSLSERHSVSQDQITIGNGSNDILELITRAIISSQHEVMFSEHAFAVYPIVTQAVGAKAIVVPAKEWANDLPSMQAIVTDSTRLIFLANPNNPTGTWFGQEEFQNFMAAIPTSVIVVLDEAYYEYAKDKNLLDTESLLRTYPNLVVCRTFSKAYGLASLRVGYALSHVDLADLMNRVRQPFNVNALAMLAAETALEDEAFIQQSVELNETGMQQLCAAFDSMGLHYIASMANFITVNLQQDGMSIYEKLLRAGVIVRPVANYGMPEHLRISIGLEDENQKFIDALARILSI